MTASDKKAKFAPTAVVSSATLSLGILMMVTAVLLAPVGDIFAKLAVTDVPPIEIGAARFLIQIIATLPILYMMGHVGEVSWASTKFNAARGFLNAMTMITFVAALKFMEVADAVAIFFVEPIILIVMGAVILKERVGIHRTSACILGFIGMIIVIRPSFAEFGWYAVLPVLAAFTVASNVLISRIHSQRENPWAMQFQSGIWGAIFCIIPLLLAPNFGMDDFSFVMPQGYILLWIVCAGIVMTFTGLLGTYAAKMVPASTLAPLQYFEIFSATLFGWLIFDHFPDALKWVGIIIIISSGLYIIWRERKISTKTVTNAAKVTTTLAP